jgi:hypothetical protein
VATVSGWAGEEKVSPRIIMAIVAGILLIVFYGIRGGRNAVWGGALLGAIVGLILALVKHDWGLLALSFAIGAFVGLGAEGLGLLSDWGKRRRY